MAVTPMNLKTTRVQYRRWRSSIAVTVGVSSRIRKVVPITEDSPERREGLSADPFVRKTRTGTVNKDSGPTVVQWRIGGLVESLTQANFVLISMTLADRVTRSGSSSS